MYILLTKGATVALVNWVRVSGDSESNLEAKDKATSNLYRRAQRIQVYGHKPKCKLRERTSWCLRHMKSFHLNMAQAYQNLTETNQVKCKPHLCPWSYLFSRFCQFRKAICVHNPKDIYPLEPRQRALALKVPAASESAGAHLLCKFRPSQWGISGCPVFYKQLF